MATEAPNLRDGTCQAAANYWNPVSALFGPAGSGQFLAVTLTGTTANVVTLVTASTQMVYGILQNSPDINQAAVFLRHSRNNLCRPFHVGRR
jgi:hypothetical protein